MDIAEALKEYLKGIPAITAIVGTGPDSRIYYDQARISMPRPLINLTEQGGEVLEGINSFSAGIIQSTFRIEAWGNNRLEANNLAETVRLNVDRRSGDWSGLWVNEVSVLVGRETRVTQPQAKGGQIVYETAYTYDIWYATTPINGAV